MEVGVEPTAFHFKITRCRYGLKKTSKKLCEAMMIAEKKMVGSLLGQEVEMDILQSLATGDENCEVIFSET